MMIETDNLTRRYGRRRGIETVNLSVAEGQLFGFLGPNGAGKTTAIRLLLGFLRPSAGWARIAGRDCWRASRVVKAEVGYVPGDLRLYNRWSGRQTLAIVERVRRREMQSHGRELADLFELDLRVAVRAMSRGMRQKLGLILAMAHRPQLLVLDEPTSTLDPLMQTAVHEHLRRLAAAGHTVFFSSHSLGEVEQLCDRVAIIRDGRIVADESLESLRAKAGRKVMIRFRQSTAELRPPACLELDKQEGRDWNGVLLGSVDELVRWLAGRDVGDLTIEPPDLDTLFRSYYDRLGRP